MTKTILTIALLVLCLLSLSFQSQPKPWEYKHTCNFKDANKLGAEGWEMVAVVGGDAVDCFYLKRAK